MEITGQTIGGSNPAQTSVQTPAVRREASPEQTNEAAEETKDIRNELREVVANLNEDIKPLNTNIAFSVDDNTGEMVVTVKDIESGDVIRQIPSEEAIELMAKMREINGIIFDKKG